MTKPNNLLRVENIPYFLECFDLRDIDSDRLYWRERPREHFESDRAWLSFNKRCPGTEAGIHDAPKHRQVIQIKDPTSHRRAEVNKHRLIWLLKHNEVPPKKLRHVPRNKRREDSASLHVGDMGFTAEKLAREIGEEIAREIRSLVFLKLFNKLLSVQLKTTLAAGGQAT